MGANVTTELKGFNLVHVVWIIYAEDGRIAALAKIPVQDSKNSTISKVLVIVSILNYGENKAVHSLCNVLHHLDGRGHFDVDVGFEHPTQHGVERNNICVGHNHFIGSILTNKGVSSILW